jgi:hypothetical protein
MVLLIVISRITDYRANPGNPHIQFFCFVLAAWPRVTKNPQPLPAVGLVKFLRSTSASGFAGYDDYQNDSLCDVFQHCQGKD